MRAKGNPGKRERGNSILEFAVVIVFLVPLLLGTYSVGMMTVKSLQVIQVRNTAAQLFVKYIDLSKTANQDLIVRTAQGLGMTRTGGNGVVFLSQVVYVGEQQCAAGGLTKFECPNFGRYAFVKRITIGNAAMTIPSEGTTAKSMFGTPDPGILNADGSIDLDDTLKDVSAIAVNVPADLPKDDAQFSFMAETVFLAPELGVAGLNLGQPLRPRPYIS
ncbi:MAG: hypothetical protein SFV54_14510 [Bryobacteraceae bacterium]|nr:hypothetical protein [Bryobacteraceae bacterium]